MTRGLAIAIWLPSRISPGQFSVSVSEEEQALIVVVIWLDSLLNLKHLHRK